MTTAEIVQKSGVKNNNRSLTWYLICRTAVITFLLGGAAFFYLNGEANRTLIFPLFLLIGVAYAEALGSAIALKKISNTNLLTQIQIVWDLLFVSVLIPLTGGLESVFSFAYLLVIISASFLLTRRLTIMAAACAIILFGGILYLQYVNGLSFFNLSRSVPDGTFFSTLFVHGVAFFLTAILSGTLAERWRLSEEQLQRKTVDYAELEKMNQTILAHISSGLMLINAEGKIHSFNRAATSITGLSFQDVYNRDATKIFPGLPLSPIITTEPLNRAEGYFVKNDGQKLILGYATTLAKGSQGENFGILVTFQDLTQLKRVEEDLKRIDRLAAVGRLAAGMAHEIRNPLASISGSVQLLMEAKTVQPDDLRLMGIIVKEAERLNGLLTDFLEFAKPKQPQTEAVNVASILDQLIEMLTTDPRFDHIEISREYPKVYILELDRNLILQALWDLAVNATEAMQGQGELTFSIGPKGKPAIIVEDSGPGIDNEIRGRIFEPFFSTKQEGTGLGLANVYSVIEAHGGMVTVERGAGGGARFSLLFVSAEGQ
jgi:two-component system sensor histidine kinase PilS (NtrC family)